MVHVDSGAGISCPLHPAETILARVPPLTNHGACEHETELMKSGKESVNAQKQLP